MKEKIITIHTTSFSRGNQPPLRMLEEAGHMVLLNPFGRVMTPDEIIEFAKHSVGVIAGTEKYDRRVLERLSNLKVISRCGTGMDNIDVIAAENMGIRVFNTPDAPTVAVAELTIGLMIGLLRKLTRMDIHMRRGEWHKLMGNLLSRRKIGIIGFGRIGQKVAEFLLAFDAEPAYFDVEEKTCLLNCERKNLEELLEWAEIVTLHLSPSGTFLPLIGENEIRCMKEGGMLINVSRGGVVDEDALFRALKEGRLAGAALDVFIQEPYRGPLTELDNVILTPHIGSYAAETRLEMETQAVNNLLKELEVTI